MKLIFRCLPEHEPFLLRPQPAAQSLPDWLRQMPSRAISDVLGGLEVRTLKHCAPMLDAMQTGVLFLLPCDVEVRGGEFFWQWDLPRSASSRQTRSPIGLHVPEQASGMPGQTDKDFVVKFNNFWTIETEPDVSMLFTHPLNRSDLPFRSFAGVVDTDRYSSGFVHFPAHWIDRHFEGVLARGTPVAQGIPFRRGQMQLEWTAMSDADIELHGREQDLLQTDPGHYRKVRRANRT